MQKTRSILSLKGLCCWEREYRCLKQQSTMLPLALLVRIHMVSSVNDVFGGMETAFD